MRSTLRLVTFGLLSFALSTHSIADNGETRQVRQGGEDRTYADNPNNPPLNTNVLNEPLDGSVDSGAVNEPPVSDPLADGRRIQQYAVEQIAALTGSTSADPDGEIVEYRWSQVSGPTDLALQVNQPDFDVELPDSIEGIENGCNASCARYEISLTVVDDSTRETTETVVIEVFDPNEPPDVVVTPSVDSVDTTDDPVLRDFHLCVTDPNGDYSGDFTVTPTSSPAPNSISEVAYAGGGGSCSGTRHQIRVEAPGAGRDTSMTYELSVVVRDEHGTESAASPYRLTVENTYNPPPEFTSLGVDDDPVDEGRQTRLYATVTDDRSVSSITWTQTSGPTMTAIEQGANYLRVEAPFINGDETVTFDVTATDEDGASTTEALSFVIAERTTGVDYDPPSMNVVVAPDPVPENEDATITSNASDPSGIQSVEYRQISGPATTVVSASNSSARIRPSDVDSDQVVVYEVTATDTTNLQSTEQVSFTVARVNQSPVLSSHYETARTPVYEGDVVTLRASATDDRSIDRYTFVQFSGPAATITDQGDDYITFIAPEFENQGNIAFEVTVFDNEGASDVQYPSLLIDGRRPEDYPPVAAPYASSDPVDEGDSVTLFAGASDENGSVEDYQWRQTAGPMAAVVADNGDRLILTAPSVSADTPMTFEVLVTDDHGYTGTGSVTLVVANVNQAPSVSPTATPDPVGEGQEVTIRANASDDAGVATVSYRRVTGTTSATLISENNTESVWRIGQISGETGTIRFEVTATDTDGLSTSQEITVGITRVNEPPQASPFANPNPVPEGELTDLYADLSDDDPAGASYSWNQVSGPAMVFVEQSGGGARYRVRAPDVSGDVNAVWEVTVTDAEGASVTEQVTVAITNVNQPPTLNPVWNPNPAEERQQATLTVNASDDSGIASVSYAQQGGHSGLVVVSENATRAIYQMPEVSSDSYVTIRVTVTDNDGESTSQLARVDVLDVPNSSPQAAPTAEFDPVDEGISMRLYANASDSDGTVVSYNFVQTGGPSWSLVQDNGDEILIQAPQVDGDQVLSFRVDVEDDLGATGSGSSSFTVTDADHSGNQPPTVSPSESSESVGEGATNTLFANAVDSDGTIAGYDWVQTAGPAWTVVQDTGDQLRVRMPSTTADVLIEYTVRATDNHGAEGSGAGSFTLTNSVANQAPTVSPSFSSNPAQDDGVRVTLFSGAADSDGSISSTTYTQTQGPSVTWDGAGNTDERSFFTPNISTSNSVSLVFDVESQDNEGATTTRQAVLTLEDGNVPPTLSPTWSPSPAPSGQVATLEANASDPDGISIVSYTQVSGPTATIESQNSTRALVRMPTVATDETIVFEVLAQDGGGAQTRETAQVVVTPPVTNDPPITNASFEFDPRDEGLSNRLFANASDSDGTIVRVDYVQVAGPAITPTSQNRTSFDFTVPEVSADTMVTFDVTAEDDAGDTDTRRTSFVISHVPTPPTVNPSWNPSPVDEGQTATLTSNAADEKGIHTVTYNQIAGPAATIQSQSASQAVVLMPQVSADSTVTFEVTARNTQGIETTRTASITVRDVPANEPPVTNAAWQSPSVPEGATNHLFSNASDSDGSVASVSYTQTAGPAVAVVSESSTSLEVLTPEVSSDETVTYLVTVTDDQGETASSSASFIVEDTSVSAPGVVDAGRDIVVPPETNFRLYGTARHPGFYDNVVTFEQTAGPAATRYSEDTVLSPVFTAPAIPFLGGDQILEFTLTVTSDSGSSLSDTVQVTVRENAPEFDFTRMDISPTCVGDTGPARGFPGSDAQCELNPDQADSSVEAFWLGLSPSMISDPSNGTVADAIGADNAGSTTVTLPSAPTKLVTLLVSGRSTAGATEGTSAAAIRSIYVEQPMFELSGIEAPDEVYTQSPFVAEAVESAGNDESAIAWSWTVDHPDSSEFIVTNHNDGTATIEKTVNTATTFDVVVNATAPSGATDTARKTVRAIGHSGVIAIAGPDVDAYPREVVVLDGTSSVGATSLSWTQHRGAAASFTSIAPGVIEVAIDQSWPYYQEDGGYLEFKLTASDGSTTDTDIVRITILEPAIAVRRSDGRFHFPILGPGPYEWDDISDAGWSEDGIFPLSRVNISNRVFPFTHGFTPGSYEFNMERNAVSVAPHNDHWKEPDTSYYEGSAGVPVRENHPWSNVGGRLDDGGACAVSGGIYGSNDAALQFVTKKHHSFAEEQYRRYHGSWFACDYGDVDFRFEMNASLNVLPYSEQSEWNISNNLPKWSVDLQPANVDWTFDYRTKNGTLAQPSIRMNKQAYTSVFSNVFTENELVLDLQQYPSQSGPGLRDVDLSSHFVPELRHILPTRIAGNWFVWGSFYSGEEVVRTCFVVSSLVCESSSDPSVNGVWSLRFGAESPSGDEVYWDNDGVLHSRDSDGAAPGGVYAHDVAGSEIVVVWQDEPEPHLSGCHKRFEVLTFMVSPVGSSGVMDPSLHMAGSITRESECGPEPEPTDVYRLKRD